MMHPDRRGSSSGDFDLDLDDSETIELIPVGSGGPQQRRGTTTTAATNEYDSSAPSSGNAPLLTQNQLLQQQQQQQQQQLELSPISPQESPQQAPATTSKPRRHTSYHAQSNPNTAFHPRLIFSQIAALQSFHYLFLCLGFQFNHFIFGTAITIDRIWTDKYLDLWSGQGWVDNGTIFLSALFGAGLLALLVEKSKKCLDFAVTLFFIHFLTCCWYAGMPKTGSWWIVHIMATILMTLVGEYLCSIVEMNEIPLLPLGG